LCVGISRDSTHKRRPTGGKRISIRKKRKFELGRPAAMTKLVSGIKKRVRTVRARGGNIKFRALRLDFGSFSWGSEGMSANPPINSGVCLTNAIIIITPPNQTIVRSFVRSTSLLWAWVRLSRC
jgi:ribosomal protein eS8